MGIVRKAIIFAVGTFVVVGIIGSGGPKDCSATTTCTAKERLAWRDVVEAKEAEKARSLGMAWHSFTRDVGVAGREFGADVRQIGRDMK